MGSYLRLLGSLVQNLVRRLGEDLADCAVVCRRGVVYKLRRFRLRYDDVGPSTAEPEDCHLQPEILAALVESVKSKPWFCELDRTTAQDLVHDGGPGCFLVRPSASTKSLTLTLWHRHRAYNILIRHREDGLLALGSRKNQEMTFQSVEEMVQYYEQQPLILYSGGEPAGQTKLKAPPPGLVPSSTTNVVSDSRRNSSTVNKRPAEDVHSHLALTRSRTLSSSADSTFNSSTRPKDSDRLRALSPGNVETPYIVGAKSPENVHRSDRKHRCRTLSSGSVEASINTYERPKDVSGPANVKNNIRTVSYENVERALNVEQRYLEDVHKKSVKSKSSHFSSKSAEVPIGSTGKPENLNKSSSLINELRTVVLRTKEYSDAGTSGKSLGNENPPSFYVNTVLPKFPAKNNSLEDCKSSSRKVSDAFEIDRSFNPLPHGNSITNRLPTNKRLTQSTPNIEIKPTHNSISRRISSENVTDVKAPPILHPRPMSTLFI